MHVGQIGQHFNLHPNFQFKKRRHYPIIPTGMRCNIKGSWQLATTLINDYTMGVVSLVYYLHCGCGYPMVIILKIRLLVSTDYTNMTDRQTDTARWHRQHAAYA